MAAFIDAITLQAKTVMHEREEDILRAWQENIEEATENEKDFPPLKLGIAATVDIENNAITTELRFTVSYKSKISTELPDPNQMQIPGIE